MKRVDLLFWGFIYSHWLPWIGSFVLLGFHLFSLVTLDRRFSTFGDSFARFGYLGSVVFYFWGFIRSLWLPWISTFLLFGVLSLALVTLDQRFNPFRGSFARFGYPGSALSSFSGFFRSLWLPWFNSFLLFGVLVLALVTLDQHFPPFRGSCARFGYPGSALSSFSGFLCSLWLPWISGFLLLGIHSLALVTLDQRFSPFGDSFARFSYPQTTFSYLLVPFARFGYPESAVNKKRIGITQFHSCHV